MLHSGVLLVAVPMVALLAAALYIYHKSQPQSHGPEGPTMNREPWGTGLQSRSTSARRRRNRLRNNGNEGQSSPESPDSGFAEEDHCEICFEDMSTLTKVQLYPCKHSDICQTCVNKLLISNQRQCPFCRARIDGFVEAESGTLYG